MRPLLYPPAGPESIGEVLDAGFRIFRSTLRHCLPYSVLAMIAGQLPNIRDLMLEHPLRQGADRDVLWWSCEIASLAAAVLLWSAVVVRQDTFCRGQRST